MQLLSELTVDSFLGSLALFLCGVVGWAFTKMVNRRCAKVLSSKLHIQTADKVADSDLHIPSEKAQLSPAARRRQRRRAAAADAASAVTSEAPAPDAATPPAAPEPAAAAPEPPAAACGSKSVASLLVAYDLFESFPPSRRSSEPGTPPPEEAESEEVAAADEAGAAGLAEEKPGTDKGTSTEDEDEGGAQLLGGEGDSDPGSDLAEEVVDEELLREDDEDTEAVCTCEDILGLDTASESEDFPSPHYTPLLMPTAMPDSPPSALWCSFGPVEVSPQAVPPPAWGLCGAGAAAGVFTDGQRCYEPLPCGDGQDLFTDGSQVYAMMKVPINASMGQGNDADVAFDGGFPCDFGVECWDHGADDEADAEAEDAEWNMAWDFKPARYAPEDSRQTWSQ